MSGCWAWDGKQEREWILLRMKLSLNEEGGLSEGNPGLFWVLGSQGKFPARIYL